MRRSGQYFISTAILMVAGTASALAQTDGASPNATDDDRNTGLEEIIVTAQRRSENLQDVPITITAVTAQALERTATSGVNAIAMVTPGLNFTAPAGNLTPYLRGVGTAAAAAGNSASVATYVDGVYIAGMSSTLFEFNNIERIEVLKGPQGTLFGRNSTGGVIHVITGDPTFDPQVRLRAGYGSYDTVEGSVYASGGITDDVAIDFAGLYRQQHKGWSFNFATGEDVAKQGDLLLRSKLLFTPGDNTRIVIAADYSRTNPASTALNRPYENTLTRPGGVAHRGRFWDTNQDTYIKPYARQGGASFTVEQELGDVKLRSVTAYRKTHSSMTIDLDGTQVPALAITVAERSQTYTQELQLLSNDDGPFQWIVGAFYLTGFAKSPPFVNPAFRIFADQDVDSISGFAQGTYEIDEATRVTGGLRYTSDQYVFNAQRQLKATGIFEAPFAERVSSQAKLTWRLSLDHKFTDGLMAYASYNRGFRAGTFNLTDPAAPALRPEVLDAIEVGFKADIADPRIRLNVAAYHYDFKDIQLARADETAQRTLNASSAKIKGIDADLSASLTNNLTVFLGVAYTHGRYGSFLNAPISTNRPGGGNIVVFGDASGNRIIRTPTISGNAGINYAIPTSVGEFNISANYYHNGGWFAEADNRLKAPAYDLLNGSIGWTSDNEKLSAQLWVKNLTNKEYYAHLTAVGPGDVAIQAAPRTYGITLGVNF